MKIDNNNPYVGLRPFEMDESILFFGRNEQTLELLQRLHQHHFVAVVGSSGCGKSSLLRAGLIPSLKAGYLIDDSDEWFVAIMKPGKNPLYNLAESMLRQANANTTDNEISAFVQKINEGGADVILDLIAPIEKEKNINFFLLVDQFEELFRFEMDQKDANKKDEAIDFVNIILELSQQKNIPFFVVITMRSDFIGDCTQFYRLPETLNKSQYLVPRLNRMEMKMVVEGPAKLYGGKFNPALTSKLLNESSKVKDELPLLQHALMRMWDFENTENKSGEVDIIDYEKIGGIDKALSNHADEALAGLKEDEKAIAKKLFQALTAIDENGRKIRRPVLLSQLKELTGTVEEKLLKIIDLFIKDRRSFLTINKAGSSNDKVIDISHESLIRQWSTLNQWVEEEGESASNYLQLAEAARLHKQNKKDLLSGSELQIALNWHSKYHPSATWANRYKAGFEEAEKYLLESEKSENAEKEAEKVRTKREIVNKRRQRLLTLGIGLLLVVAAGTSVMIINSNKKSKTISLQNDQITRELHRADSATLEARFQKNIADSNSKLAKGSEQFAREQRTLADIERIKAIEEKKKAEIARNDASKREMNAVAAQREADRQAQIAREQENMANIQLSVALSQQDELAQKVKFLSGINDTITSAIKELQYEKNPNIIYQKLKQISNSFYSENGDKIEFEVLAGDTRKANSNDFLKPGQALESLNKKYLMVFQHDGSLIVYKKKGMIARWTSSTFGAVSAGMLPNGNFVIYKKSNNDISEIVWETKTAGHPNAYIVMQEDGNLVIYDDAGDHKKPIWASGSFDPNWEFDD